MPLAVFSPLVPALEEDAHLGWNEVHSGLALGIYALCEATGLFLLGWLSDVYGETMMLVSSLGITSLLLMMIARQQHPSTILVLIAVSALLRGIVFPAVTRSMNTYLKVTQWEIGLCLIGLASRAGDLLTSELTGLLQMVCGWRGTLSWIACITGCAVAMFYLVVWNANKMRKENGEDDDVGPEGSHTLTAPRWSALKDFYSKTDTWLILALASFLQPVWSMGNYVAIFAHTIYGMSAANSALTNGSFSLGQAISLLATCVFALYKGHCRREVYVACAISCFLASIVPIILLKVSFVYYVVLMTAMGIVVGTVTYVPVAVYCMHISQRTGDYALYCSSLYSVAYIVGGSTGFLYGHLREESEQLAFRKIMIVTAVCLLVSGSCMALHTHRNWDGALFKYTKASGSQNDSRHLA